MLHKWLSAIVALTLTTACSHGRDILGPLTGCAAPRSIAITVDVSDAISGRAIADSATGTAHLGATTITLDHYNTLTLLGGTQLGTYDVMVERPGYRAWTRLGVSVAQTGPCGNVEPVNLSAHMQPVP
jgi:hypothetical protein